MEVRITGGEPTTHPDFFDILHKFQEENIYVSPITTLYGTPATTGSDFYWTSCCRPSSFDMVNILSGGYYLRASMFPYTDPSTSSVLSVGSSTGGASCYDSSPEFASNPATVICAGYPFTYNHNAVDEELDSLHYEWSRPLLSANNGVTWKPGYSTASQLPGSGAAGPGGPATTRTPSPPARLPVPQYRTSHHRAG